MNNGDKKFENKFLTIYYERPRERWYSVTVKSKGEENEANFYIRGLGWQFYFKLLDGLIKPHKVLHEYTDISLHTQ